MTKVFLKIYRILFSSGRFRANIISALWVSLSIGALMLAGFLSIFIMLGRSPVIYELISNTHWLKRALIVHVDLALLVWFYGFLCGLFVLIPVPNIQNRLPVAGYLLAVLGVIFIILSIFISSAQPVLSNYIPVLDHPIFIAGLLFFGAGIFVTLFNRRLFVTAKSSRQQLPSILPVSALPALQAAAVIFVVSVIVFLGAWIITPETYQVQTYYEFVIWGGGHLLQFVNIATTVAVWLMLLQQLLGRNPLPYKWSALLFILFTLPVLAAPLLLVNGTSNARYITGFTRYMQWGIFPVISIFMIFFTVILIRKKHSVSFVQNPFLNGLVISMFFLVFSFVLGALIQGSNTMVPAHYHASLGGITIAFMATTFLLMDFYGLPLSNKDIRKKAAIQPLLFGLGQAIFVSGLAYAGAHGLARKVFGAEQQINSVEVYTGLSLLFIGGSLAITGGMLFFWIVIKAWKNMEDSTSPSFLSE